MSSEFLRYAFAGLMWGAVFMAVSVAYNVLSSKQKTMENADTLLMLAAILFCVAAIALKLWGGFPA